MKIIFLASLILIICVIIAITTAACLFRKGYFDIKIIDVNKSPTLKMCLDLYEQEGVATVIEDGEIKDFIKED